MWLQRSTSTIPRRSDSKAPRLNVPWAVTPLYPFKEDVVSGRNSAKLVPSTEEEADALYAQECARVATDFFTSHTQKSLTQPLAKNEMFHHYYKKHATILGLAKDLPSSDSDSETDENYSTKIFKRRMHFPIMNKRDEARRQNQAAAGGTQGQDMSEEERLKHKRAQQKPWTYRCPSVNDLGVYSEDPHHEGRLAKVARAAKADERGKKVFPKGFQPDTRYEEPKRIRLSAKEAYVKWMQESRETPTSLPNPWDDRLIAEEESQRLRRRQGPTPEARSRSVLLSPVEQTKQRIAEERAAEGSALGKASRSGKISRLSGHTQRAIEERVAELLSSERESLGRHRQIMDLIHKIPVKDPLNGSTV